MPRKSSSSTIRRRRTTRRGKRTIRGRSNNIRTTRTRQSISSTPSRRGSSSNSLALSARTRKAIDTLPSHAQKIYSKAHKNALKQYENPSKRRGGKRQSKEQIAHKVAWSAVKKEYKKKGDKWVPKKD
ncbi:MAG TPA: ChaB family protein [Nitrososphaera sp.]|nr:ChaB family protein [Nitrososphaera sp.]